MLIAAIEAGGTKFACGLLEASGTGRDRPQILDRATIPTTTPAETLKSAADFLRQASERSGRGKPDALGIGCFGPVDLLPASPTFGCITATPKPGWGNTRIAGYFGSELELPAAFDTDVNAAAFGEYLWGAAVGRRDFIYLTVGTGIGGGVFSNGLVIHGISHPELGHVKIRREEGDTFEGACPFHRDCLEGLASGPAVAARWGMKAESLPPDHPAWELEARYLAKALAGYVLVLSPELIILGGGVGMRAGLAERVSALVGEELAGYVPPLADPKRLEALVSRPGLGADAGLYGAAALAIRGTRD
jgi:fructokinase